MPEPEKADATRELVTAIAELTGLKVEQDAAVELASQVHSMRDSINAMDKLDLHGVTPATVFTLTPR